MFLVIGSSGGVGVSNSSGSHVFAVDEVPVMKMASFIAIGNGIVIIHAGV